MRRIPDTERRARLATRHGLAPAARLETVEAAVDAMTCLHATEPANVYLSAVARTDASIAEMDRALYEDRSVVRQLAMRRTVFAFPRALLPAVWGSASARVASQLRARLAKDAQACGITSDGDAWATTTCRAVLDHLEEVGPATTAQLRAAIPALEARVVVAADKSYGGEFPIAPRVLSTLAADGAVLRGRNDGGWKTSRPYWTLAGQWLEDLPDALDERAGYAILVDRWLRTFGPGTESDLVWWLGATKAAVRTALADVEAQAVELADGSPAWLHPEDTERVSGPKQWAALLPALDPTTMGWKQRDFYLGEHADKMFDRNGNGGPTAWWNGRIVGGWTQREDGSVIVVPAQRLAKAPLDALRREAERLTSWLDGDVVRSIYQSPLVRQSSLAE